MWQTVYPMVFNDPWEVLGKPASELAAIRFTVTTQLSEDAKAERQGLGPERLRIVGSVEALGEWDNNQGIDLFWSGSQWSTTLIDMLPDQEFTCCLLHLKEAENLLTLHPYEAQAKRVITEDKRFTLKTPKAGEVLEIVLELGSEEVPKSVEPSPRSVCALQTPDDFGKRLADHPEGSQQIYVFDGPNGVRLDFCLYLPPNFRQADKPWPLLVFLHAMHSRLDSDISLFYEAEAPTRLLLDTTFSNKHCPSLLREGFVVLCPQCPRDNVHMYGSGVWFRTDWHATFKYMPEVEQDLAALIDMVGHHARIDQDFVALTGTSMGGMGTLEFASRRPGLIKVCVPVAAHFEFDLDALVERLTKEQSVPIWLIHAMEDSLCPYETIDKLAQKLREKSRAEVCFTGYHDDWSFSGHCADRVSYQVCPRSEGQPALGDDVFSWILAQRSKPPA